LQTKDYLSKKHRKRMKKVRTMSFAGISFCLSLLAVALGTWLDRYAPDIRIGGGGIVMTGIFILGVAYVGSDRIVYRMVHKPRLARRFVDRQ